MLIPDADSLTVRALPADGRAWRIDWVGNLAFPNRAIRRTQPSVLLHFSRVRDDSYSPEDLLSPTSTNVQYQRKCWVSVGSLGLFRIGDIWRNGKREASPDYQTEIFPDLVISSSTTIIVKAGLSLNGDDFLLPLDEHPWHRENTQSYCLAVDLPDDRRMIIPCYELIRFYFGSSGNFLSQLFQPPLNRNRLYDSHRFNQVTKHLQISLASKLSGSSAADIGRIARDPIAWRAAALVGTSSLKASVTGQPIYPQALFPFEGITTLTASGKWLSHGGRPNATFIVFSLRSCSHSFPFQSLRYETAMAGMLQSHERARNNESAGSNSGRFRGASDTPDGNLVEQDASSKLSPKAKSYQVDERFPDLIGKSILKAKMLKDSEGKLVGASSSQPISKFAVGDPGSVSRIRPVDLILARQAAQRKIMPIPAFLRPLVKYLGDLKDERVKLLTASEEDGWTIPVPLVGDEDGVIDLLTFQIQGEGSLRLKRIAFFEVSNVKGKMLVVAVETICDDCMPRYAVLREEVNVTEEDAFRRMVRFLLFLENAKYNKGERGSAVVWDTEEISKLMKKVH
jgi:hypothetical protein